MPRRKKADRLSTLIGRRIRQLRAEVGLTMEKLAYESELGSKGHLSNIERGLVHPTVHTLEMLSERLGVLLLDLVTFPERSERERLIDLARRRTTAPQARGSIRRAVPTKRRRKT